MRKNGIALESAPVSMNSINTFATDDGNGLPTSSSESEPSHDRRRRRDRRKKQRPGIDTRKMMTPAVNVLLFGVVLSFLDVLYIMKHLEKATDLEITQQAISARKQHHDPDVNYININAKEQKSHLSKHIKTETKKKGTINVDELIAEREPIMKLITNAGIEFDPVEDAALIEELPKWSDVVEMYGPEPVIYGLNEGNCQRFQAQTDVGDHLIGTAGIFNTGTNLLSELLIQNCVMPERMKKHGKTSRGIRWQVPWGKHAPAGDKEYRKKHKTKKDWNIDAEEVMPMVAIRDPLVWMKSMCRHKYTARWLGFSNVEHCPDFTMKNLKMTVKYDGFSREYTSLLQLWNEYYQDYKNIDIPYLMVRFEDLVFHAEETTKQICECGGGRMYRPKFRYVVDSAKKGEAAHGKMSDRTGYVDALIKYGTLAKRYEKWTSVEDLNFVKENIDTSIMKMMGYADIDPSWNSRVVEEDDEIDEDGTMEGNGEFQEADEGGDDGTDDGSNAGDDESADAE